MESTIKLIAETETKNAYGALVKTETEREIYCEVESVGRSDFFNGLQSGLGFSFVFVTNPINYQGERVVEYEGQRYAVVRTYHAKIDRLEIYTGERVGAHGSN